jgi:hypothetical protein
MLLLMAAVSMTALAACGKKADMASSGPASPPPASADSRAGSQTSGADAAAPQPTVRTPMLAMAYQLRLALPSDQVRPMMESHQDACERAGPTQCQVLGADAKSEGRDDESATLNLRATPAWMREFRTRAEADAKDAHGRILQSGTASEDLAKAIGDTQAGQKTRVEEEARLKDLLVRRTRHVGDSLAVEQEITQVQNDLNAQASALQDMQDRVAMQTLTIAYESTGQVEPSGPNAPVASAAKAFWGNMMSVLGALVVMASYLLPVALLIGGAAWLFGRLQRPKLTPRPPQPGPQPGA